MSQIDRHPTRERPLRFAWGEVVFTQRWRRSVLLEAAATAPWRPQRVAHEIWCHPTRFDRPDVRDHCLAVVLDGAGTWLVGERSWRLGPGSVFWFGPGGSHGYRSLPGEELEVVVNDIAGPDVAAALQGLLGSPRGALHCPRRDLVLQAARLLADTAAAAQPWQVETCAHLQRSLLHLIAGAAGDAPESGGRHLVERARLLMQREWRSLEGARAVAAALGIGLPHLCRQFRHHLGTSPQAHLVRLKMRHAAAELLEGVTLPDLAAAYGYADPFAFSKAFKRVTGLAPSHYRQRYRS